ncbi:hypothetical protein P170DRAFT_344609 [Aspergillus steynii IBT 23096]|uniref:Uncharacterized protein n=1 Tax=Aspergillus steynii IBT 23096 TaxID=1392250 RepID=A0A2I2GLU4_9EURO|nr:uncharacterized protein P170DRAFT_344609 [Aspergillus steynii IBT 23096]PLB53848.1 hypothetical protein P170DRAFT_344609 [Aspergillus steynii IBT 23096]
MAEESSYFHRYARIKLRCLKFEYSYFRKKILNLLYLKVLQEKFKTNSYTYKEPQNFIIAIVTDDLLERIIAQSDLSLDTLKDNTNLLWLTVPKDIQILYLYRKYQVETTKYSLLPGNY